MNMKGGNQIFDIQNNNFLLKNIQERVPSSVSNNNLNIIMNSDNLQQSITSTMTIYNSAVFDDASILRFLDNTTISEESSVFGLDLDRKQQQQSSKVHHSIDLESNFKFECEDVKQILGNISIKFKEKLQKNRIHNSSTSQSQFIAISNEELKQFDILATSAIEKIRQLQSIGKQVIEHSKIKNLQFKNQKQNLKIHLHQ